MDGTQLESPIVVGVDGSTTSYAAVSWAAREAELHRCGLHIVTVLDLPAEYGDGIRLPETYFADRDRAARTHLAEARIQHRLDGELAAEPVEVLNWVDRIHAAFPDTAGDPSVLRTARACAKADPDGEWLPEYLQVEATA